MAWNLPIGFNFADGATPLPAQPYGSGGQAVIVGTPLPTADIQIWNQTGLIPVPPNGAFTAGIEEPPGSPVIDGAEQCTCSHTLVMSYYQAQLYFAVMPRGTVVNDTGGNIWRVLSRSIKRTQMLMAEYSYVMESISFDTPPDEFDLQDVDLDLDITKHPRYNWCLLPYVSDASTYKMVGNTPIYYTAIKEAIVRMIQTYKESPFFPSATNINGLIHSSIINQINPDANGNYALDVQIRNPTPLSPGAPLVDPVRWNGNNADLPANNCEFFIVQVTGSLNDSSDPMAIALAAVKELISKLWRQEDTPIIPAYEVSLVQYFFAPIFLNPGGYLEDPRDWVPGYFMNPYDSGTVIPRVAQSKPGQASGPVGGESGNTNNYDTSAADGSGESSIFDFMTKINPQCFSTTGLYGGPLSISSLRRSDKYRYERTFFGVTHRWQVSCVGAWDNELYTQNNRPQVATDFNQQAANQESI